MSTLDEILVTEKAFERNEILSALMNAFCNYRDWPTRESPDRDNVEITLTSSGDIYEILFKGDSFFFYMGEDSENVKELEAMLDKHQLQLTLSIKRNWPIVRVY